MKPAAFLSLSSAVLLAPSSSFLVDAFSTKHPSSTAADRKTSSGTSLSHRMRLSVAPVGDGDADSTASFRRRQLLRLPLLVPLAIVGQPPAPAAHAAMEKAASVFKSAGAVLTQDEAANRLWEGRRSVSYLIDHYEEICEGGGDNVRRYLGTVGTSSGLFGIGKAMKALAERADDIVEYTELMNEVEACIQQADGSSYMAIFVTTSTSQDRPEKYFKEALVEIKRLAKNIDDLAAMVQVDVKS